jgi:hypothetical protein
LEEVMNRKEKELEVLNKFIKEFGELLVRTNRELQESNSKEVLIQGIVEASNVMLDLFKRNTFPYLSAEDIGTLVKIYSKVAASDNF